MVLRFYLSWSMFAVTSSCLRYLLRLTLHIAGWQTRHNFLKLKRVVRKTGSNLKENKKTGKHIILNFVWETVFEQSGQSCATRKKTTLRKTGSGLY